jgi:carbonic anhydrase/acetyltransferase-like protein (isoleucine patch superfamily)
MIKPFNEHTPRIGRDVFVAPDAWVIGDVALGDEASIFFGAVLRGDIQRISIGARSNVQEHAVLHSSTNRSAVIVGEETTVGHRAIIHGGVVGRRVIVGMGSIILDDAVVEDECLIGAGAVVTEGKRIPARSLVLGTPGRVVRTLTAEELEYLRLSAEHYVQKGGEYRRLKLG